MSTAITTQATPKAKTVPYANAFDVVRKGHGVILCEFDVARVSTALQGAHALIAALQGAHALIAVLQKREMDAEIDASNSLVLCPLVTQGLLAALATCTEYASDTMDNGGTLGQRAEYGTPAYAELESAKWRVLAANSKEAGHA